jgi:preprotein translocase SecE subunit
MSWVQILQGAFLKIHVEDKTLSDNKKKEPTKTESFKESFKTYFKGVRSEWGKIVWPERRQVIYETIVVLGVVIFFTVMVLFVDRIFCIALHPTNICKTCLHPGEPGACR